MRGTMNGWMSGLLPICMAVATVVTLTHSVPARADDLYSVDREVDTVRGWTIGVNKQRNGCLAYASFESGTLIEIGYDTNADAGFLVFANTEWDLDNGSEYDARLTFSNGKRWSARAEGVEVDDMMGLAFENVQARFILDFANYSSIQLHVEGEHLDGFSLAGTREAIKALLTCTQYVSDQ